MPLRSYDDALQEGMEKLALLVAENYSRRALGCAPDEWFWADAVMLECGYSIGRDNKPTKFTR